MPPPTPALLAFDDIAIDFAGRRVLRGGAEQSLEPKAFGVLALLAETPGRAFTRDEILDAVWGHRHVTPGVLNRVMTLLRHALGEDAQGARYLHTVHGVGYRFDPPASVPAPFPVPETPSAPPMRRAGDARRAFPRMAQWLLLLPLLALLAFAGWRLWPRVAPATPTPTAPAPAVPAMERSIAVLPFANASKDADQQFFSDGLSDNLIDALSRFEGLKVIGRMSSFQFRDGKEDGKAIGAKLGAAYLVGGSVQRAGGMVRINATLTKAADGSTFWAEHYDRPYTDLFALQDEIAASIASALQAKLLSPAVVAEQDDRPPGGDIEAYNAYLRGMQSFYDDDTGKVIEYQQQATRLDPRYASAWAQLAIAWTFRGNDEIWGSAPAKQDFANARAAVDTALRLSPDLGIAHGALGNLLFTDGIHWQDALAELRRGAQLAPDSGQNQGGLSRILAATGKLHEAIEHRNRFVSIEPLFPTNYYLRSQLMAAAGRLDEAEQDLRVMQELDPAPRPSHRLMYIAILRGDARAAMRVARAQSAPYLAVSVALAAQAGADRAFADDALAKLLADEATTGANPYRVAQVYALRGDARKTVEWLERAWAIRDTGIHQLLYDPLILRFRKEPLLVAFCERIGLPPPDTSEALGIDQIRAGLTRKR
ncbi:MAG: winged helix-turn-helix domain-containing protein [Thermomonas sp.]